MFIVESRNMDVYRNLATEEYLMDEVRDCGPILFLWQSDCAVVMGKNQNPWRECRLGLMEKEGIPLARRVSGGGTVYHDAGNLNYCVITDREKYCEEQAFEMVLKALASLGVSAERSGKSNLSTGGLKFSGNAFAFRKGRAMHHGTLLLNTDLERLNRYLGPTFGDIDTHAVASVPAEVVNLNLEQVALTRVMEGVFCEVYGGEAVRRSAAELDEQALEVLAAHQRSDEWRYDATPGFSVQVAGVGLTVRKGVVVDGPYTGRPFREVVNSLFC